MLPQFLTEDRRQHLPTTAGTNGTQTRQRKQNSSSPPGHTGNKTENIVKKISLWIALIIFGGTAPTLAQTNEEDAVTVTNYQGKKENIELPASMTQELDSLMNLYNTKTYLKADDECDLPDINPVYSQEVYKERLAQLPTIIEMPYNDIVQKFIDRYSSELRRKVAYMLGAQNFYMPIFEEALEAYDLPLELKYLPVIESGLNPKAVSRAKATGLWQFMLPTAKRYGLTVNSLVDERRDIVKSSYAAAHYLSDLYKIFGDWNLVIAAYNCGPEKINKSIHRLKGEKDYWKIYSLLPKETRGYVPAFIAANYIMNYYCEHNICPFTAKLPVKTDTVMVDRDVHFEQIAHIVGIDVAQLETLNPQYRRSVVNGYGHPSALRLPADLINVFLDNEDSVYTFNTKNYLTKRKEAGPTDNGTYVVRNNQVARIEGHNSSSANTKTAGGNAFLADSSTADGDGDTATGTEGESAQPTATSQRSAKQSSRNSKRKTKNTRSKSRSARSKSVTIKNGDTLSEIAERNHTTVAKLRKLNGIKGNNIRAGKKIKVK